MVILNRFFLSIVFALILISSASAIPFSIDLRGTPLTLSQAQRVGIEDELGIEGDEDKLQMRLEAMQEAALSYGAQSGMLYRNWEIYKIISQREIILDSVFNFSNLMIPSYYGTLIEPPIISESENAFLLNDNGMSASLTSKIYSIGENAKIVTTPRNWRNYILDYIDLSSIEKPHEVLKPRSSDEEKIWDEYVRKGWNNGLDQANDIFESKLDLLMSDYLGMIRYKKLLAQKMVSAPLAVKEDRGVTGDSNELRIDDKAIIITSTPSLNKSTNRWDPTER